MNTWVENIKTEIIELLSIEKLSEEESKELISSKIYRHGRENGLSIDDCILLSDKIFDAMFRLDILQKYLDDIEVSEIMVNGLSPIIIEKHGKIIITTERFSDLETLENIIQTIVSKVNRRVNASSPIADIRLLDGSRVNVVLPPVSLKGPILTIRKFDNSRYDLSHLIKIGTITEEAANILITLVRAKYNIFISGGTSSGKTTFLNALSEHIPKNERVITIEDSAELSLKGIDNLVTLESKPPNSEGNNSITMEELIKSSLRMRPDRIVVGEVRGKEALEMLNAMNTGHDGSLSTGHGNSAKDMLKRLELMVLRAVEIPIEVVKQLNSSSIDILIHLEKNIDGKRVVQEIIELEKYEDDYKFNQLFDTESGILIKKNLLKNTKKLLKARKRYD